MEKSVKVIAVEAAQKIVELHGIRADTIRIKWLVKQDGTSVAYAVEIDGDAV